MPACSFALDTSLINLSGAHWTIRNAVEGVQIFGGIGSGKTSGSGRYLALKYLKAGFGGLVLTAKPDERILWEQYCKETNRLDDLIIISPGGKNHFNFLEYESKTADGKKSITENIVQVLKTVIRAGEEKDKGQSDDAFWEVALDMLITNLIDLCFLAYGKVTVQLMYEIAQSLSKKDGKPKEQLLKPVADDGKETVKEEVSAFKKAMETARQSINRQLVEAQSKFTAEEKEILEFSDDGESLIFSAVPDARIFKFVRQFFYDTFFNLAEKTRSIIDFSFSSFLFRLLREPVFSLFCNQTSNVVPEDCFNGKIILIDLPVKIYHKVGRDCQVLFKYIWQRAMEKRQVDENSRPVYLWADEAQHFLHEGDTEYQATARSSKIATVYLSQNLPNYYANMGGAKSDYRVKGFLGTLGTKIFHANADIETNKYASELIGDIYYHEISRSETAAVDFSSTRSVHGKFDRAIRPEEFAQLLTGGSENDKKVEAIIHIQRKLLLDKTNYIKRQFDQNKIPN